jgi:hypothetical protein
MPTEIQPTDEQHFVRLILEASFATMEDVGPSPDNPAEMDVHMARWLQLMRRHDPRLEALDDETLTRLLNTPMDLDEDDDDDDDDDDGESDEAD